MTKLNKNSDRIFLVSGFWFRVSVFGFLISGFGLQGPGFTEYPPAAGALSRRHLCDESRNGVDVCEASKCGVNHMRD